MHAQRVVGFKKTFSENFFPNILEKVFTDPNIFDTRADTSVGSCWQFMDLFMYVKIINVDGSFQQRFVCGYLFCNSLIPSSHFIH
jgi:hypothetical protein